MLRIVRSEESRADALEAWLYIAVSNERAADRMVEKLNDAIHLLAEHPRAGPARDEWGKGLRSYPVDSYVIVYKATKRVLSIVRILHGARDIPRSLQ
jgi:toxin ParE1/3/4